MFYGQQYQKGFCGAVERLRRRSREQNVPSSIPRLGISVEVTLSMLILGLYMFNVVCAARLEICRIALVS